MLQSYLTYLLDLLADKLDFRFSSPEIGSIILFLPGYASLNKRLESSV